MESRPPYLEVQDVKMTFPLLKTLNIPDDVFEYDTEFKPKGSARRMQEVIETFQLLVEEDDDDIEFSMDQLVSDRHRWAGISTSPCKKKAESIMKNKDPAKTFWEFDQNDKIKLQELNFADIKTEEDEEMPYVHFTKENNNINFYEGTESDRSFDNLKNANDTTIGMNSEIEELESEYKDKSINNPPLSPKEDACSKAKSKTRRPSSRKAKPNCVIIPRPFVSSATTVTVFEKTSQTHLPEICIQLPIKRRRNKLHSGSILKPHDYFQSGKSNVVTILKPGEHFKSNSFGPCEAMIPIKPRSFP